LIRWLDDGAINLDYHHGQLPAQVCTRCLGTRNSFYKCLQCDVVECPHCYSRNLAPEHAASHLMVQLQPSKYGIFYTEGDRVDPDCPFDVALADSFKDDDQYLLPNEQPASSHRRCINDAIVPPNAQSAYASLLTAPAPTNDASGSAAATATATGTGTGTGAAAGAYSNVPASAATPYALLSEADELSDAASAIPAAAYGTLASRSFVGVLDSAAELGGYASITKLHDEPAAFGYGAAATSTNTTTTIAAISATGYTSLADSPPLPNDDKPAADNAYGSLAKAPPVGAGAYGSLSAVVPAAAGAYGSLSNAPAADAASSTPESGSYNAQAAANQQASSYGSLTAAPHQVEPSNSSNATSSNAYGHSLSSQPIDAGNAYLPTLGTAGNLGASAYSASLAAPVATTAMAINSAIAGSSSGTGSGSVNWNELFQQVAETPATTLEAKIDKWHRLLALSERFESVATAIGKQIIAERNLPLDKQTIKPINVGGTAGGEKFLSNGVFFKVRKTDNQPTRQSANEPMREPTSQ